MYLFYFIFLLFLFLFVFCFDLCVCVFKSLCYNPLDTILCSVYIIVNNDLLAFWCLHHSNPEPTNFELDGLASVPRAKSRDHLCTVDYYCCIYLVMPG